MKSREELLSTIEKCMLELRIFKYQASPENQSLLQKWIDTDLQKVLEAVYDASPSQISHKKESNEDFLKKIIFNKTMLECFVNDDQVKVSEMLNVMYASIIAIYKNFETKPSQPFIESKQQADLNYSDSDDDTISPSELDNFTYKHFVESSPNHAALRTESPTLFKDSSPEPASPHAKPLGGERQGEDKDDSPSLRR